MAQYGVGTRSPEQQEIDDIFALMDAAIRTNTYSVSDFFAMIGDLADKSPILAQSIAKHAANVMDGMGGGPVKPFATWTDIVVESYRRALFDIDESPRYGTPFLLTNIAAMRQFVQDYIENATMGDYAHPGTSAATSMGRQ